MRLVWLVLPAALCLSPGVSGAAGTDDDNAAVAETGDAVRREQRELRDRARALREQRATTEALLEKQEAYLRALEQQVQELKKAPRDD